MRPNRREPAATNAGPLALLGRLILIAFLAGLAIEPHIVSANGPPHRTFKHYTRLGDLAAPLPVVDHTFSGPQQDVQDYDSMRLLTQNGAEQMFHDAWAELNVPAADREAVDELDKGYLEGGAAVSLFGPWLRPPGRLELIPDFNALVQRFHSAVQGDPENADRLNNAAVALLLSSTFSAYQHLRTDSCSDTWGFSQMSQSIAVWLLEQTRSWFPANRAVLLNLAYAQLETYDAGWNATSGYVQLPIAFSADSHLPSPTSLLSSEIKAFPTDRTGRLLLASLEATNDDAGKGLATAKSLLAPVAADPASSALGDAALGDADLASAITRQNEAPYVSQDLAHHALDNYDRAAAASDDPALQAGRASALEFLASHGATPMQSAVDAQMQAAAGDPASLAFKLRLATLQERSGDYRGALSSAQGVLDEVRAGWNPLVARIRVLRSASSLTGFAGFDTSPGDAGSIGRGYMGFSYGSDADQLSVPIVPIATPSCVRLAATGGGGFTGAPFHVIEPSNPALEAGDLSAIPPGAATVLALQAAILLRDAAAGQAVLNTYKATMWYGCVGCPFEGWEADVPQYAKAANIVGGIDTHPSPRAVEMAADTFREVGRYGDVYQVYHDTRVRNYQEGMAEASFLLGTYSDGDPQSRLQDLSRAYSIIADFYPKDRKKHDKPADPSVDPDLMTFGSQDDPNYGDMLDYVDIARMAAEAASAAGQSGQAARYRKRAESILSPVTRKKHPETGQDDNVIPYAMLGDLALLDGVATHRRDARIKAFQRADGFYGKAAKRLLQGGASVAATEGLAQRVYNNRGVARMYLAQARVGTAAPCGGKEKNLCRDAAFDLRKAQGYDPENPLYRANVAAVSGLLTAQPGTQTEGAERALQPAYFL